MESNSENQDGSVDGPEQADSTNAATPLFDVLDLMDKENFEPTVPDAVAEKLMQVSGCLTTDPKVTKLIAVAAQTFISVVAKDAMQHYKMRGAPQSNKFRGKDEQHNTLVMEDLISSIEDRGVVVRKPPYFV
ncbi:transcription initiation factor TFIID subunit 10-like [Phymastichus coffea]|uniref:transcription initiation factor TFIID subunit 10-like n=1 Tax=Phymastichus coffea TaxID=108790 RepID=UPI00273B9D91|nr:transcription initiation factor TFIID subunit 10-like [Phymastichus coffea]